MRNRRWVLAAAAVVGLATGTISTFAQTYPSQTVRIVVPFGAGSITDILARLISEDASKKWGQQVIVENRPGLPGTVAVARAEPDGLTLMLTSNGHAAVGYINKNLGFDPVKDFAGITRLATIPMYLIVHPDVPAKTVGELIQLAKSDPGKLNFASPGLGSGGFIAAALFKKLAGVDIIHIPYKGAPEAMTATMRGDAQIYFTPLNLTDELCAGWKNPRYCISCANAYAGAAGRADFQGERHGRRPHALVRPHRSRPSATADRQQDQ